MTLDELVAMTNRLGAPGLDYAILGEGNTSARADEGSFWVTASGTSLRTVGPDDFVRMDLDMVLAAIDGGEADDAGITRLLEETKVTPGVGPRPSVEAFMHAVFMDLEGVEVVGHTHPTAINAITCSVGFEEAVRGRLFPDEIVLCGREPLIVPYVDPGLTLAREIRRGLEDFRRTRGERPAIILMQNHGLIVLGSRPRDVENTMAMAVKAARILAGTAAFGGPRFLPPEHVERIHVRPDEHYRQNIIGGGGPTDGL